MQMNDLISRDAAINAICGCFNIMEVQGVDMTIARAIVKSALDNAPAVDAEPVRHGMWIYHPEAAWKYECSECGCYYPGEWNFCANCGAKMDDKKLDERVDGGKNDD